jgi:hypothetical protein
MTGLQNFAFAQLLGAARQRYEIRARGGDLRELAEARVALEDARIKMRASMTQV